MISFSWPWIFLLLPLPLAMHFAKAQSATSVAIPVPQGLNEALSKHETNRHSGRTSRLISLWLTWIALLCALSQPAVPGNDSTQPATGRSMTLAIDLSSSMERKDFMLNDVPVDRLTVVKQIARDFILARKGDRVGLVLFSTETFIASPPSFDLQSVAHALASSGAGMAGRTTAIGDAIGMSIRSLLKDPAKHKAIVLLSDGTNNAGSTEPESAARLAQQLGIVVHTIGMGSDIVSTSGLATYAGAAVDLDEKTLKSIAEISGGKFFRANDSAELAHIYAEIDKLEGAEFRAPAVIVNRPLAQYFTFALLLLSLVYLVLCQRQGVSQ